MELYKLFDAETYPFLRDFVGILEPLMLLVFAVLVLYFLGPKECPFMKSSEKE